MIANTRTMYSSLTLSLDGMPSDASFQVKEESRKNKQVRQAAIVFVHDARNDATRAYFERIAGGAPCTAYRVTIIHAGGIREWAGYIFNASIEYGEPQFIYAYAA